MKKDTSFDLIKNIIPISLYQVITLVNPLQNLLIKNIPYKTKLNNNKQIVIVLKYFFLKKLNKKA